MGAFRSVMKFTFKPFVDVPGWLGLGQLKYYTHILFGSLKPSFTAHKGTRKETFEQAMARLNLSEDDLKLRARNYIRQTIIHLFFAVFPSGVLGALWAPVTYS